MTAELGPSFTCDLDIVLVVLENLSSEAFSGVVSPLFLLFYCNTGLQYLH